MVVSCIFILPVKVAFDQYYHLFQGLQQIL